MQTNTTIVKGLENSNSALDFVWLELTNRCNLKCVHCYAESSPSAGDGDILSEKDYLSLINQVFDLGCRKIQFIGGEPTLNKSLPGLIKAAAVKNFEVIEVFTNLTRLPDQLLDVFCRYNVSIATSFYSYDPQIHDDITRQKGSFERTVTNMKRILDSGLELRAAIIEMEQNKEDLSKTWEFLEDMGVKNIGKDHIRSIGRADSDNCSDMGQLCGNCAGDILSIGPDGTVAPCIMSKKWSVGSVLETPLSNLVQSEKLFNVRQQIADAMPEEFTAQCTPCAPNSPNCQPNCSPSASCTPCSPNGGHKCAPNLWCRPAK